MPPTEPPRQALVARWRRKFTCALRGLWAALGRQDSFFVHVFAGLAVVLVAAWLGASRTDWLLLVLCITAVFAAELFNTAIEHLARAVTRENDPELRDALDVASGAVLTVAVGAAVVGATIFLGLL